MCAILKSLWIGKLIGKPVALTIADWESEARRRSNQSYFLSELNTYARSFVNFETWRC